MKEAWIPGLELTGDSGWGEHASLGQGQGGSEKAPFSDPGQEAGGAGHGSPDPGLVAACTEVAPLAPGEDGGGVGGRGGGRWRSRGSFGSFQC